MTDNISLVAMALGFVFTAGVFLKVGYRNGFHAADLGSVSHQWVAACRASEPASSH